MCFERPREGSWQEAKHFEFVQVTFENCCAGFGDEEFENSSKYQVFILEYVSATNSDYATEYFFVHAKTSCQHGLHERCSQPALNSGVSRQRTRPAGCLKMAKKRKEKGATSTTRGAAATSSSSKQSKNIAANKGKSCRRSSITDFPPELLKNGSCCPGSSLEVLHEGAVFVSRGFFNSEECRAWIDFCEETSMESVSHPATRWIAHRECARLQRTDWSMADRLFGRLQRTILDAVASRVDISTTSQYRPVACNGNLRLYRYDKGMSFGKHVDGSDAIDRYENGNTEITVLIYLSDCVGGATRFYPTRSKKSFAFTPQAGAILLHVHGDRCLEHEADPVQQGVKYILRTDIVYANNTQVRS